MIVGIKMMILKQTVIATCMILISSALPVSADDAKVNDAGGIIPPELQPEWAVLLTDNPRLEEAARALGASRWRAIRRCASADLLIC